MDATADTVQSVQTPSVNVLVVDDHDLVRQGLRFMLEAQPGWRICGEAATGQEAVELA